jgi:hypothetical protein
MKLTAKEKAIERFDLYYLLMTEINPMASVEARKAYAKKCALICVESHFYSENDSPFPNMESWIKNEKFWNEVVSEIKKL